jgi:hypothetical protein
MFLYSDYECPNRKGSINWPLAIARGFFICYNVHMHQTKDLNSDQLDRDGATKVKVEPFVRANSWSNCSHYAGPKWRKNG